MRYEWIDEYLLKKVGVTKDLQKDWNWVRYQIGGKMFAAICKDWEGNPYYITLKLEPMEGDFLRSQYKDIVPGYYMNKMHWNSIRPDGEVPDDLLKDLLDKSYQLVLGGFSKKKQKEILEAEPPKKELSCCGTNCEKCRFYGNPCKGCNACEGRVFHVPEGKICPIYECSIETKKYENCAGCKKLPCAIWRNTRDPQFTDEAFEQNIADRVKNLQEIQNAI